MNSFIPLFLFIVSFIICRRAIFGKDYMLAIALFVPSCVYLLIPFFIIITDYKFSNGYFHYSENQLLNAIFISFLYLFIMTAVYFFLKKFSKKVRSVYTVKYEKIGKKVPIEFYFFLILAILGAYYKWSHFGTGLRDISSRGGGLIFVLGYAGYFAPIIISTKLLFLEKKISCLNIIICLASCIPSIAFFWFAGQRGGALFPVVFVLMLAFLWKFTPRAIFICIVLFVPIIFLVNYLTGIMRTLTFYGPVSSTNFFNSMDKLPLSFSHIELLATIQNVSSYSDFNYFFGSFFNWVPTQLVGIKGLTTGPLMASMFLPDVSIYQHSTSLTTGPIVESFYYFGWAFLIFPIFHGSLIFFVQKSFYHKNFVNCILFAWLLTFQIYFDDIGGVINKAVIIFILGFMSRFFRDGIIFRPISQTREIR